MTVTASDADTLRQDGVVFLPGALDAASLREAQACFEWTRSHPTVSACRFYEEASGTFYQDLCHPEAAHAYRELLTNSPIPDLIAALWQSAAVWFLYEQIFLKDGGAMRRTPWHQDAPYLALDGERIAVMWICFDPVARADSLEFVRGSHRGPMYDGSAFDPQDDTAPIYAHGLPRLPDIESARADFDIVSYAVTPGDVVVFHPAVLHGGAATRPGLRRRTLSLRFFGDDAVYAARPERAPAPMVAGLHETLRAGEPFRHPAFPQLRPLPAGFEGIPRGVASESALLSRMQHA